MNTVSHQILMPGVRLTAVQTSRFKSATLSVSLLLPMAAETASPAALLPQVLRRGTETCPNMISLSAALDELYGGSIESTARKKGETQCVGFAASFLDDAYALSGEAILEPAAALLGDLLLRPALAQGGFRADYFRGEQENLIQRIRAQINDKRQYSLTRLTERMCAGEAYGIDRLGSEPVAAALTRQSLWGSYERLLAHAPLELYYCGSAPIGRVKQALIRALEGLPTANALRKKPGCRVQTHPTGAEVRPFEDRLDVTQGKLSLGFRTGGIHAGDPRFPALMTLNAVFGGTTTSKLFMNVRERLSLCYFASSMLERHKGLMLVSSGIEFDKRDRTQAEILAQLDDCRLGKITQQELEAARRSVVSSLKTTSDTQGRLEDFWLGQSVSGLTESPEELAARVEQVTMEGVVAAANLIELDGVYFLNGQGEGA